MDFNSLKKEALKLKDKAKNAGKDALDYGAEKLASSGFTLKTPEELEKFKESSKTTEFTDKETGKKKTFHHKSLVVFADTDSTLFKEMLYMLPILQAKTFSQNMKMKLANLSMQWLHKTAYGLTDDPALVVFEDNKVFKTIEGEENIQKVVKGLSLDINKAIEEL